MAGVTVEEIHRLARIEAAFQGGQTSVWRSILHDRPPRANVTVLCFLVFLRVFAPWWYFVSQH
jgi:hypothetical protein